MTGNWRGAEVFLQFCLIMNCNLNQCVYILFLLVRFEVIKMHKMLVVRSIKSIRLVKFLCGLGSIQINMYFAIVPQETARS